jgi:hypothetical protein
VQNGLNSKEIDDKNLLSNACIFVKLFKPFCTVIFSKTKPFFEFNLVVLPSNTKKIFEG